MQGKQLTCQSSECSKASCCPLKTQIPEIPNLPASPHKQAGVETVEGEVDDGGELQTQVPGSQTGWPPLIAETTQCLTS